MNPADGLLERSGLKLPQPALLLNPPGGSPSLNTLTNAGRAVSLDYRDYIAVEPQAPKQCHFGLPEANQSYASALLYLPREKPRRDLLLQYAAAQLPIGGLLYVVGANKEGGKSANKALVAFGATRKLASGNHCVLWECKIDHPQTFALDAYQRQVSMALPCGPQLMQTLPGVFSANELDKGTALLLQALPETINGRILDFGCGCGVLSMALLQQAPNAYVDAMDVDYLALESSRINLAAFAGRAHVFASDQYQQVQERYDWIISNPPFHRGAGTHYQPAESLIGQAPGHLRTGGKLLLVANNHLPYEKWLNAHFSQVQLLKNANGFKVYQAAV